MTPRTKLDWALHWAARGWRVFPLTRGKKPGAEMTGWQNKATTDEEQIREWWARHPDANIGGCTDDRLVGDADADKGGLITLEMFQEEFGSWPETQVHITGGGGRHYIYSGPNGSSPTVKSGDNKWGPAGDIKTGPGSYIVMPG
ncbi:MAG: bifunctional DNA primase/polymerase, partial [Actinomycetota bacterium]|nr:bifunctional DNA primase/polymerase [Actinomycetota bacterium]